jgi:hypothetical protein
MTSGNTKIAPVVSIIVGFSTSLTMREGDNETADVNAWAVGLTSVKDAAKETADSPNVRDKSAKIA